MERPNPATRRTRDFNQSEWILEGVKVRLLSVKDGDSPKVPITPLPDWGLPPHAVAKTPCTDCVTKDRVEHIPLVCETRVVACSGKRAIPNVTGWV